MKNLKKEEEERMHKENARLKVVTGVDFINEIEKMALNDNVTELEVKKLLEMKYPGADKPKDLSKDDKEMLSLLFRHYFQKAKEHRRLYGAANATTLAYPTHKPDLGYYDSLFDSLISGSKFSYDVVGV